jgi:hypothetical protein
MVISINNEMEVEIKFIPLLNDIIKHHAMNVGTGWG